MIPNLEKFKEIIVKAAIAGNEAVSKAKIIPMIVGEAKSLFSNEIDYSKPVEFVESGVCGFAWINVYPEFKGSTKLGKEERKVLEAAGFSKNEYEKNYQRWVSEFNQSMQKKEAFARAFSKVLRENGINASAGSRID